MYDMYDYHRAVQNADEAMQRSAVAPAPQATGRPARAAYQAGRRMATPVAERGPAAQAVQVALDRRDNGGAWVTLPEA